MADLVLSANMDTLLQAANYAAARTTLGLTDLATTTPGTGVATALGVNVGSAGAFVVLNGAGGTPSSIVLTNATGTASGLTAGTASAVAVGGITGLGTGVAAALAVNTGSAGAPVLFNGAGGTPSSLTLTNATGLPLGSLANSAAGADRILFWDQSANDYAELTVGSGLNITNTTITATGSGTGDVVGPASSTDTAIVLWDGITGELIQDSVVLVDPVTGDITGVGDITGDTVAVTTLSLGGTTITATGAQLNAVGGAFTAASASGAASLALAEDTDNGSNTVSIAAPATVASNKTATLQDVTGTIYVTGGTDVAVADGGTGLSSGTSGGILGFTASGTIASSAALAANAIVIGGGAGATPTTTTTGTGVLTALGVNVGSAGAFVTFNGALGTPSSGTLTNATGLPASGIAAGVLGGNITLGESTGQIILDPTLSADGTWSGIMMAGTAGATLAFGDLVYLAAADSRWELADADAASTSGTVILGMCVLAAASDGDPTNILLFGKIRADAAFPALTIGGAVYVGTTAGDVQTTAPNGTDDVIRVVGFAQTSDVLVFNPSPHYFTSV